MRVSPVPTSCGYLLTFDTGLTGSVSPVYAPGMTLSRAGVVAGLDMTSEAALTKLAYLLALPDSTPESVTKAMSVSLRGELTESSQPIFRHPGGTLPERAKKLTAVGYAIAHGDLEKVEEVMRSEDGWLLNEADYSGNTPVVCYQSFSILTDMSLHSSLWRFFKIRTNLHQLPVPTSLLRVSSHPTISHHLHFSGILLTTNNSPAPCRNMSLRTYPPLPPPPRWLRSHTQSRRTYPALPRRQCGSIRAGRPAAQVRCASARGRACGG